MDETPLRITKIYRYNSQFYLNYLTTLQNSYLICLFLVYSFGKKMTNITFRANAEKIMIMNNIFTLYNAKSFVRNSMHV